MSKRFQVIDGADKGQSFLLPEAGAILIGNSRKHTDICLHDLFVARVHCQVDVEGDRVTVCDRVTPNGILINGVKVPQRELQMGDVIRVGNSYLRLEEAEVSTGTEAPDDASSPDEPGKLPILPTERLSELTNHTLAHFKLGAPLARGHCGAVFRARDLKTDELVALKVLSPAFPANPEEMQRFVRMTKPRLALRHPDLVTLCGAGKAGPYVWLATEFIEGEGLGPMIARLHTARKIPWRPALRVARHVGRALAFLHDEHLVHTNVTPANIVQPAEEGAPKLNDMGLCDALAASMLQRQTFEAKFLSELPYLSPEHVDPDAPVDDLSDQYSLGAVVYAMLTGRPPVEVGSTEETIERIRTVPAIKPKKYQDSIPDEFQAVVLQMLAKHPEDRFSGFAALLDGLDRIAE